MPVVATTDDGLVVMAKPPKYELQIDGYKQVVDSPLKAIEQAYQFARLDAKATVQLGKIRRVWMTCRLPGWEPGTGVPIRKGEAMELLLGLGHVEMVVTAVSMSTCGRAPRIISCISIAEHPGKEKA
jgi:hypothetical protein